jgi:D-arabinose 5-phosphate isomerase GutQ
VGALDDEKMIGIGHSVIEADARAVLGVRRALNDDFVQVARLLSYGTGKVLVTGSGTSATVAARAAHLFSVCGTPAFYLSPDDGLHGGLGVLQSNDFLFALSKGGGSHQLNEFCSRAKTLCRAVIAVTATADSSLAAIADHVLLISFDEGADLGEVVATGSSLAMAALVDALVEIARVERNYNWERLMFTHPSGAVGRDAARTLERLVNAKSDE